LYAAPEQIAAGLHCTEKVDVFAFGLILYEIIGDSPPFPRGRTTALPSVEIPDDYGLFMQDLIPRCWSHAPTARPSFQDIFDEMVNCSFGILPGVDAAAISQAVTAVLHLEPL
jgi:hypothetical protein